jgi:hypothetical protein
MIYYLKRKTSFFKSPSEKIQLFNDESKNLILQASKYRSDSGSKYLIGNNAKLSERDSIGRI